MNNKEFKRKFREIAQGFGFDRAYGGWYKQSEECIAVLELQKSDYADYYYLRGKIFINGVFDRNHIVNKGLIKDPTGDLGFGETEKYRLVFNFEEYMDDKERIEKLRQLFNEIIIPFTDKASTLAGVIDMVENDKIPTLTVVKEELAKLVNNRG